jgi:hypothetical protein
MNLQIKPQSSKFVLLVLADFATERNKSAVSNEGFQFATGMTLAQIEYALQNLVDSRVIEDSGQRVGDQKEIRVFQLMMLKPLEKIKRRAKQTGLAFTEAEEILKLYPRPVDKPTSLSHINKAILKYGFEFVKERTISFSKTWQGRTDINSFCPHSTTFYSPRRERFADDPKTWGGAGAKPVSPGPTFTEVKAYIAEKGIVDDRGYASSFYNGWQQKGWMQNGKIIEWQIALSKALARWRGETQPAAPSA